MMTLTVDRFEGDFAVLQSDEGQVLKLPQEWMPSHLAEGKVLRVTVNVRHDSAGVEFLMDEVEAERRRGEAATLRAALSKTPEGDLSL